MHHNVINYGAVVASLVKPGSAIKTSMTAESCNMLHMTVGISSEAGELLDAIKKATIYNKPLDRENIIEEMGDIEFYLEGLRQALGITREVVLLNNISKLGCRYASGAYSDKQAITRADKEQI